MSLCTWSPAMPRLRVIPNSRPLASVAPVQYRRRPRSLAVPHWLPVLSLQPAGIKERLTADRGVHHLVRDRLPFRLLEARPGAEHVMARARSPCGTVRRLLR